MNDRRDLEDIKLPDLKDSDLRDLGPELLGIGSDVNPDLLDEDFGDPVPRKRARKSSSGLLALIGFLMIVGGGGAFAYLNKDILIPLVNDFAPGTFPVAGTSVPPPAPSSPVPLPPADPTVAAPENPPAPVDSVAAPPVTTPDTAPPAVDPLAELPQPEPVMNETGAGDLAAPAPLSDAPPATADAAPATPAPDLPAAPSVAADDSSPAVVVPDAAVAPPPAEALTPSADAPAVATPPVDPLAGSPDVPPVTSTLEPEKPKDVKDFDPLLKEMEQVKKDLEKTQDNASAAVPPIAWTPESGRPPTSKEMDAMLEDMKQTQKELEKAHKTFEDIASTLEDLQAGKTDIPPLPDLAKKLPVPEADEFISSEGTLDELADMAGSRLKLTPEQEAQGLGVTIGTPKHKPAIRPPAPVAEPDRGASLPPLTEPAPTSPAFDPEAQIAAANRALELERYQAAADMFNDLYKVNQRDERILMGRAVALQKLGRDAEAIRAYDELIALNPNNPDVMINALGLVRKQNPTEALSRLLNLRQKYPTNPTIAAQIGLVNAELGNFDEGLRYLNIAADIESTNPRHFFNMAVIGERMKRPDLAVRYYEQALKADALSGNVRNRLDRDMVYDRLSIVRQQMR